MANLSISLNDQAWISTSRKLKEGGQSLTAKVITRVATLMERTAKENIRESVYSSPRSKVYNRTGKARQSIVRSPINAMTQRVYMGVNYGKYLEEGTGIYNGRTPYWTNFGGLLERPIRYKGMPARPFWMPAIKTTRENVQRIFNEEVSKMMK